MVVWQTYSLFLNLSNPACCPLWGRIRLVNTSPRVENSSVQTPFTEATFRLPPPSYQGRYLSRPTLNCWLLRSCGEGRELSPSLLPVSRRDGLGSHPQLVPGFLAIILAFPSTSLLQQASSGQDSPASVATDSTVATNPNSPQTPSTPPWSSTAFGQQSYPKSSYHAPSTSERETQCRGPWGQYHAGDQISMSEKGNAVNPGSGFQTPGSSIRDDRGSPRGPHQAAQRTGDVSAHHDYGAIPHSNGDQRVQQAPQRLLGVHNILNPPGSHIVAEGDPTHLSRAREQGDISHSPSPVQHGLPRPFFPGQHGAGSLPGTPVASAMPLVAPGGSGRTSPSNYPHPALQNPRRILSPKGPRGANISHGVLSRDPDPRLQPRMASASPAKRQYEPDPTEDYRGHPMAGHHSSSLPHTPIIPGASISRSFSQPVTQPPGGPHAPPMAVPPREHHGRPSVSPMQVPMQSPGTHGGRTFAHSGPPGPPGGQRPQSWSESIRQPVIAGEAQQAFMTLPGSDTPIPVSVDTTQASRKASEKRQRNANASTRHRAKRRALQEENARHLQELKDERQEMEVKMAELMEQRDFYRNDRNRLRDIVRATPSISDLAAAPPSPTGPSESNLLSRTHHAPTPSREYSSEASSAERPAQRPRLDDRSDTSIPSYGTAPTGASGIHTPMQGSGYGVPPRPTSASSSSGGGERLPPLRSMEGPPPTQGPPQEQDPRTGQWVPIQPRHYETGWATGPRRPSDGSQR